MLRGRSFCLLIVLLLSACRAAPPVPADVQPDWTYADLRLLDSLDAPEPTQELVAVFLRFARRSLHIRLDLLEIASQPDSDLYLAIDTGTGGSRALPIKAAADLEWDTLLLIPAAGAIRSLAPGGQVRRDLAVRVLRDPVLDTLIIRLDPMALPRTQPGLRLQVFLTPAGSPSLSDYSKPLRLEGAPPPQAQVLFAFWNTFPAYTPALALRRWDGAHTGPQGGRHGLYNLLRAARNHQVPLALLDLTTPASLAALDYAGGLDMVRSMSQERLLILPDSVPNFPAGYPAWVYARAAQDSRKATGILGLASSPFVYLPQMTGSQPTYTASYRVVFTRQAALPGLENAAFTVDAGLSLRLAAARPLLSRLGQLVIPVPASAEINAASEAGPGLEMRRALVATALTALPGGGPVLVLGGDLPDSTWGNPQVARAAFAYLRAHPWIRFLNAHDLLTGRNLRAAYTDVAGPPAQASSTNESSLMSEKLLQALQAGPDNLFSEAAWQAFVALHHPLYTEPTSLAGLRQIYQGQVGVLLAAARWAADPASAATCEVDLDGDGRPECLLASAQIFAVFDPRNGALTYAFARTATGPHQFIAPSAQFITGLSDPSTWDFNRGLQADPAVIPGAFSKTSFFPTSGDISSAGGLPSAAPLQPVLEAGRLTFLAADGRPDRAFYLTPRGLRAHFFSAGPHSLQVPLALDPWQRFSPGWGGSYRGQATGQGFRWSLDNGPAVELNSNGPVSIRTFADTRRRMGAVEDPNFEFPPGHYLPFPLAVVTVEAQGEVELQIEVSG